MKMTREQIIRYWASEPKIKPCEAGCIRINLTDIPFPDVSTLTAAERDLLRDKIMPEVLLNEIPVFGEWVGPVIQ
jgi:hypothetical protein